MDIELVKLVDQNEDFNFAVEILHESRSDKVEWNRKICDLFLKHSMCIMGYPCTYIIKKDSIAIGMYQILNNDLVQIQDLSPWFANLYILPEYRGLGISRIVMEDLKNKCLELNIKKIYLHSKHENYYEKFGFEFLMNVPSLKKNKDDKRVYFKNML